MSEEKKLFFENSRKLRLFLYVFAGSLVLLLAFEPFIHKHPYFAWDGWFGFYGFYGFGACVLLALAAKFILRPLVKRGEEYYD